MRLPDIKIILAALFVFLVVTDGAAFGANVQSFIEWVASGWDSLQEFFDSLTDIDEARG